MSMSREGWIEGCKVLRVVREAGGEDERMNGVGSTVGWLAMRCSAVSVLEHAMVAAAAGRDVHGKHSRRRRVMAVVELT